MMQFLKFWCLYLCCLILIEDVQAHSLHHNQSSSIGANLIFVALPSPFVEIKKNNRYIYIRSNGIPNHKTGQFPGKGNPHKIEIQKHYYRVASNPIKSDKPIPIKLFGVALNGIPFEPGTAEC